MALQTSGAISLNDMHLELGSSTGTAVSLNDADVRGLIDKASGASMSFSEWHGASDTTTYAWKFTFTPSTKREYVSVASGSLDHVYNVGDSFPDIYTSSLTIPTNRKVNVRVNAGTVGGTGGLYRIWAGFEIRDASDGLVSRDNDGDFMYDDMTWKTGATVVLYNTTTSTTIDSWSGTDSSSEPALTYAGEYFYPGNQTNADGTTNGWDDFGTPPSDGDSVELRVIV